MKKEMILLAAALLGVVGGCGIEKENKPPYLLHGAWLLQQAEYPSGGETSYDLEGSGTFCVIFEGDSMYYECRLASTPSGLVMMPVDKGMVTLIDKGGGELLYMENNDPHPLTVADSIITIQHDGILHTWVRADDIYREWGNEIRDIIAHDIDQRCTREMARYVLSSIERQQERTIHWFGYFSAFIVLVALVAAHLAFTNRRVRRQLQLQL